MIAKRYDDEVMLGVERCDDGKYKYCTTDGKLAFKKPGKDFFRGNKAKLQECICYKRRNIHWRICWKIIAMEGMHHSSKTTN